MPTRVFLSPHLDDAVFSCGGLMAKWISKANRVLVVTVCAGDPPAGELSAFARQLHERWQGGGCPVAIRRQEDLEACRKLGAEAVHLEVPDAIYRRDPAGNVLYGSEQAIFGPVHPQEGVRLQSLCDGLSASLPEDAVLYVPLGIGGHVDHRLTRLAAERLGRPLFYYHDFPYAVRGEALPPELPQPVGKELVISLSQRDVRRWIEAARQYRSQISTFWENPRALGSELRQFQRQAGGLPLIATG